MMSGDNKQDLQEFCIFMLSFGDMSMTLLMRRFQSYRPPVRPAPGHIAPTLVTTASHLSTEQ